jgi:hypothetical protein
VVLRCGDGSRCEKRLELGWVRWILGVLSLHLYRIVGQQKVGGQGEGGSGGGTLMVPVIGHGNEEGEAMGCGRF